MKIVCKNCNGVYDSKLSKCPYCSTMNKRGAYRDFRYEVTDIIDKLIGLKSETSKSLSSVIFSSVIKGLLIALICLLLGTVFGFMTNINYYNDREYDEETLKDILWADENLYKLDEAYERNDFETVKSLIYENTHVTYSWKHYAIFMLKDAYNSCVDYDGKNEYTFQKILYYLFYPEYYANTRKMNNEDYEEYLSDRTKILEMMERHGYSEIELKTIYDSCKDEYGYLNISDVRKMLKEDKNG